MMVGNKVKVIDSLEEGKLNDIFVKVGCLSFVNEIRITKKDVARYLEVSTRTVEKYLSIYRLDFLNYGKTVFVLKRDEAEKMVGSKINSRARKIVLLNKKHVLLLACFLFRSSGVAKRIVEYLIELENISNKKVKKQAICKIIKNKKMSKEELQSRVKFLENKIKEYRPLVSFAETVTKSDKEISLDIFAKLTYDKLGLGRNKLFILLREKEILDSRNIPKQCYISRGYFKLRKRFLGGKEKNQPLITGKGQVWLLSKILIK